MRLFTFDTETTGLEPGSRLLELHSCLLAEDGSTAAEFTAMVNPGMPIPPDVTAINHITDAMVTGCDDARAVLHRWLDWLDEHEARVGVAHFAPYDVGILGWELGRAGLRQPDIDIICTKSMAAAIKATPKNNLQVLVEHYSIKRLGDAHRAQSDADACRQYFLLARDIVAASDHRSRWAPEYGYPTQLPPALAGIDKAIADGREFAFGYVDAKGVRTDRAIIPYGYAQTANGIAFHGLCLMRKERRTFLADRVQNAAAAGAG